MSYFRGFIIGITGGLCATSVYTAVTLNSMRSDLLSMGDLQMRQSELLAEIADYLREIRYLQSAINSKINTKDKS